MNTKTTVKNEPAPISPQEAAVQGQQAELIKAQTAALQDQTAFQKQMFSTAQPALEQQFKLQEALNRNFSPEMQAQFAVQQFKDAQEMGPIQKELMQLQLDSIRNGGKATPEQSALIDEQFGNELERGKSDLNESMGFGLEQLRRELAPSLGLRPTDTPIQDRGFMLERQGQKELGKLELGLRGGAAAAKLNYPLNAGAMTNQSAQFQQSMAQAIKDFQQQLSEQAVSNRLKLGMGAGGGNSPQFGNPYSLNLNRGGGTQSTASPWGLQQYATVAAGIGSAMSGYAALAAL